MAYKEKRIAATLNLKPDEFAIFENRCKQCGMNKQQFLRKCALGETIITKDVLGQLMVEVRNEGNNLNQIAMHCNEHPMFVGHYLEQIDGTLTRLEEIWQSLNLSIRKNTKPKE